MINHTYATAYYEEKPNGDEEWIAVALNTVPVSENTCSDLTRLAPPFNSFHHGSSLFLNLSCCLGDLKITEIHIQQKGHNTSTSLNMKLNVRFCAIEVDPFAVSEYIIVQILLSNNKMAHCRLSSI